MLQADVHFFVYYLNIRVKVPNIANVELWKLGKSKENVNKVLIKQKLKNKMETTNQSNASFFH